MITPEMIRAAVEAARLNVQLVETPEGWVVRCRDYMGVREEFSPRARERAEELARKQVAYMAIHTLNLPATPDMDATSTYAWSRFRAESEMTVEEGVREIVAELEGRGLLPMTREAPAVETHVSFLEAIRAAAAAADQTRRPQLLMVEGDDWGGAPAAYRVVSIIDLEHAKREGWRSYQTIRPDCPETREFLARARRPSEEA